MVFIIRISYILGREAPGEVRGSAQRDGNDMKILVVEDYGPLLKSLTRGLCEEGYAVDASSDGEDGLLFAQTGEYDVIILDIMLPGLDGLEILKRLRAENNPAQVLVLTARDTVPDRVKGLDLGADDYLVKPFEFSELLARVRALVRRKYDQKNPTIHTGDLEIDTTARRALYSGVPLELTAREYAILEFLASRSGRIVSRTEIFESVYDFSSEAESNVIEVYIARIRRKIRSLGGEGVVNTVRGFGYRVGGE